jgi:hypothetical protein
MTAKPIGPDSWYAEIPAAVLVCITSCLMIGCSSRDVDLENTLSKELSKFSHSQVEVLDLRTVLGTEWEMVCIQEPYQPEDEFEKQVGRTVRGYSIAQDDVYRFWIFYRDNTYRWANVPRVAVMDKQQGRDSWCTTIDSPLLYSSEVAGVKRYYFIDNEKHTGGK